MGHGFEIGLASTDAQCSHNIKLTFLHSCAAHEKEEADGKKTPGDTCAARREISLLCKHPWMRLLKGDDDKFRCHALSAGWDHHKAMIHISRYFNFAMTNGN
jgi:hypothetical protein